MFAHVTQDFNCLCSTRPSYPHSHLILLCMLILPEVMSSSHCELCSFFNMVCRQGIFRSRGGMCTYCKGTVYNFLPSGHNCVFLVLSSSPSHGQDYVLILANHLDELSFIKMATCLRLIYTAYMQQRHNR